LVVVLGACLTAAAAVDVHAVGLKGDGETNDTAALRKAIAGGGQELYFPAGSYRLGSLEVPADTTLRFSPRARIVIEPTEIRILDDILPKSELRPWLILTGDGIVLEGLDTTGLFEAKLARGKKTLQAVNLLIYAKDVADLRFTGLRATYSVDYGRGNKLAPTVAFLQGCSDVALTDSHFENIMHGIETVGCRNVSVHGNRAVRCNTITTFRNSEGLRHYDNWSRNVVYQCVFRGGSPDPSRKAPQVPLGSSATAIRGIDPQDPNYSPHVAGAYDIQISRNYAEYGRTLAWGNKGRQVIFDGNVCRFTTDYAYGVEGCENVTFANNIAINCRSVGIMTMYWGDRVVITGNQVIVRDEPYVQEYSAFSSQNQYWGGLLRFHHGPTTKEDNEAGSRYGAGKVIVSGNLLVNELPDQVRGINIEGGRDVLISGNRIVNGMVRKNGAGSVSIIGNEFTSNMPVEHRMAAFGSGAERVIIKDNVMRFAGGTSQALAAREVTVSNEDEAEPVKADEKLPIPAPAITCTGETKSLTMMLVEGNIIQGWLGDAIQLNAPARETGPVGFVVRGNSVEGAIRITGLPESYRSVTANNLNLKLFEPVQPVIEAQEPMVK